MKSIIISLIALFPVVAFAHQFPIILNATPLELSRTGLVSLNITSANGDTKVVELSATDIRQSVTKKIDLSSLDVIKNCTALWSYNSLPNDIVPLENSTLSDADVICTIDLVGQQITVAPRTHVKNIAIAIEPSSFRRTGAKFMVYALQPKEISHASGTPTWTYRPAIGALKSSRVQQTVLRSVFYMNNVDAQLVPSWYASSAKTTGADVGSVDDKITVR